MRISRNKKIIIGAAVVVGLTTIVILSKSLGSNEGQPVQTAKIEKRARIDSKVSASGEVRPVQFFEITAEVNGRVDQIYVNEGDSVKKGQPLIKVDPTQFTLQSAGQEAVVRSAAADVNNSQVTVQAAENTVNQNKSLLAAAEQDLARDQASLRYAQNDYNRKQQLVEQGVLSKGDFDLVRSTLEQQQAVVKSQESHVLQLKQQVHDSELGVDKAKAGLDGAVGRLKTAQATLGQQNDFLKRTIEYSPIEGVISSLPVKVGTFAIANFSSTPLLTVADMSNINAEIKVDETDIASVAIGQKAKVKVDALGDAEMDGEVIEKAASAVTRSGQAISSQTAGGSQEAKDFVVKVRLNPTPEIRAKLRPGMSTTAIITTATVENSLAAPLQAIVPREEDGAKGADEPGDKDKDKDAPKDDKAKSASQSKKHEVEGVFVLGSDKRAHFYKVETGVKGDQEIQIKSGLSEGDEIIVGPYKTLRSLKNGDQIKREVKTESTQTGTPAK